MSDKKIPLAGVIGCPVAHSKSPQLQTHWLKTYGIAGHYIPMHVEPEDLETVIRTLPKAGFVGVNVTIPHKEAVMMIADKVTDRAKLMGAANTVIFRSDGSILADNTDGYGFITNLHQGAPDWVPANGPAVVLGAGGACRAVVASLIEAGVPEILLTNRTRERAEQLQKDFGKRIKFNVEGYLKDFSQLVVINRNKVLTTESDYSTETGEAYGIDFTIKYETPRLYLWTTYSMGFVNRFDGEQTYPTIFDRRHNVNFLATYSLGEKKDLLLSLRWNLGSGFPFTKTQAFYDNISFADGVDTEYETQNPDEIGILYSETRNGGRLPYYHRLDLSVQKTFEISEDLEVETVLSVSNTYDRDNIFYFDRVEYQRVNQLPIIPSLGVRINF
mgnify:CR=1 FL=1